MLGLVCGQEFKKQYFYYQAYIWSFVILKGMDLIFCDLLRLDLMWIALGLQDKSIKFDKKNYLDTLQVTLTPLFE